MTSANPGLLPEIPRVSFHDIAKTDKYPGPGFEVTTYCTVDGVPARLTIEANHKEPQNYNDAFIDLLDPVRFDWSRLVTFSAHQMPHFPVMWDTSHQDETVNLLNQVAIRLHGLATALVLTARLRFAETEAAAKVVEEAALTSYRTSLTDADFLRAPDQTGLHKATEEPPRYVENVAGRERPARPVREDVADRERPARPVREDVADRERPARPVRTDEAAVETAGEAHGV